MRAAIYARVSSKLQRDRHTIDSQLASGRAFVAAQGWTVAGEFVDDGRTAKAGHLEARGDFQRLLVAVGAREVDVVVVVDIDRLTRAEDLAERGAVLGAFQKAQVRIAISSTGQILDLDSSLGDLYSGLQAFFAAEENRKRRERTVRGKIEAARKGRKPAGPTPYGYSYERATGLWSIDEAAAVVVRECYDRVAAGESCYRVSIELETRAVPRPRSGHWVRGRVHQMIVNSAYRGVYTVDKRRGLTVVVPRLVSDELWTTAQSMLPAARRPVPRAPRSRRWNLIEGLGRCGECGKPIQITGSGGGKRYYCCVEKKLEGRLAARCPNRMRIVEQLDELVWAELRRILERPDLVNDVLAQRRVVWEGGDWRAEFRSYERQLTALEDAEATILDRFRRGRISAGAMDRELEAAGRQRQLLERNRDLARQRLEGAARAEEDARALVCAVTALRSRAESATAAERQRLARSLIERVTLWRERLEITGRLLPEVAFQAIATG